MKPGGEVGAETLPSTFSRNWGDGVIFANFSDYIGFTAKAKIHAPRNGLFRFTIGSDDGMKLSIDNQVIIDNQWSGGGSYASQSRQIELSRGTHNLLLRYYERTGGAAASFDCDHELLTWTETVE